MSRRHKQLSRRGAVSKILETSGDKFTKTPTAELLRELRALGLTVEQIIPLVEVAERELFRRRLARASENSGTGSFDELERFIRQMHDNLSAHIGDTKKARRLILDALPARHRRVWAALLARRGRPPGDGGRVARQKEVWLWFYKIKQAEDPPMDLSKFAKWLHEEMGQGASVESTRKKLKGFLRK